ncbi:DUF1232 domain-containing protein [Knoellia subterranea]|uniref:DUF1232 domain-containing protein n=1 Tax=Knoellia subterranea KCTC 19937 TaxID=1385521 RepID=A0A0A0JIZ8_9MICO|nr:DUF1232 domain-containing protein [Knoellia subterranea]KGN36759.1 hypothetical protein N803_17220 [Knoellia subterranea KCTC 19937]
MDDVLRVVLIGIGVILGAFLLVVGFLMWRYRIPPRGVVALAMAGFYLVVPVDVVPEAVLGPLGLADDAGVVGLAVLFALRVARARKVLRDSGVDFSRKRD